MKVSCAVSQLVRMYITVMMYSAKKVLKVSEAAKSVWYWSHALLAKYKSIKTEQCLSLGCHIHNGT